MYVLMRYGDLAHRFGDVARHDFIMWKLLCRTSFPESGLEAAKPTTASKTVACNIK
jgi:hypothetical protein